MDKFEINIFIIYYIEFLNIENVMFNKILYLYEKWFNF